MIAYVNFHFPNYQTRVTMIAPLNPVSFTDIYTKNI